MPDIASAGIFLDTLNNCHPSAKFTMEVKRNASLPFIGVELLNLATRIKTKVYVKPTNTGLSLYYQSHVDIRYKRSLITTMLDHIVRLVLLLTRMRMRLEIAFLKLKYPKHLFNLAVKKFVDSKVSDQQHIPSTDTTTPPIRVIIPFKDQVSANVVKKRLTDLSSKIRTTIQPVLVSRKLNEDLKVREVKPATVNQQCVVYKFQRNLRDAGYVGYICTLAATSTNALMDTNKNRRQFVSIILATIIQTYHLVFQNNFTCLPNVLTNLFA